MGLVSQHILYSHDSFILMEFFIRPIFSMQSFFYTNTQLYYIISLSLLTDPEQENSINEDLEVPPHRKRGGKCKLVYHIYQQGCS